MILFHPNQPDFSHLDEKSKELMVKTIEFFEKKGKVKLKHDDHERVWYADFLEFQKQAQAFATLMTPSGYGASDSRWDSSRNCNFSEILGFYGLAYWYTWQVSMLGLGPIWNSKNEDMRKRAAQYLQEGEIFAFGLSEKEHGADLIGTDMMLEKKADGTYIADGDKYYIGNANKAAMVSVFGKMKDSGQYVFFVADARRPDYKLIKNTTNSQNYVAEFLLENYPVASNEILDMGRDAWDSSLSTIAYCKYNLGWASVGMSTHALYEALNHASKRKLYNMYVTDFPHVKQLFVDAYSRLVAMRLFTARASDYMKSASAEDRRYLLYNPMVKMKVTMQGEEVVNLIWDVIAAKGFEKDMFFEMAARDIRALPKLEGTAHVNMILINNFIQSFLFESKEYPEVPFQEKSNDEFLFNQGATTKGLKNILFHDYNLAYAKKDLPNIRVFKEQIDTLKYFLKDSPLEKAQTRDIDFMLPFGEIFTLIPYGQLVIENAIHTNLPDEILDQIFDFMVRDFSKYALQVYSKPSATGKQLENLMKMIKKPITDENRYNKVWQEHVFTLAGVYEMKP